MTDPASESMVIGCGCGAKMRVRAAAAGKKAKCPKCGAVVPIPAAAATTTATTVKPTGGELNDLIRMEKSAAPAEPVAGMRCPQCKIQMATGAKICISCGFNVETGQALTTSDGSPGKMTVAAKSLGTFALGATLSAIGAAIGGAVWFLVSWSTNYEVGYVAWGIGVLAGLGMHWGHRSGSVKSGVVAAGMSAMGVFGAKLAIFIFVFYSIVSGDTDDITMQREYLKLQMADEMLDERGVVSEKEREEKWEGVYDEADQKVAGMSDEEVRRKWKDYREKEAAELEEDDDEVALADDGNESGDGTDAEGESAPVDESSTDDASGAIGALLMLFFISSFGLFDLLWFFLAISSAYKIGCGVAVGET